MNITRVRFRQEGVHTKIRIFVGKKDTTLAQAGELTMRMDEAEAFFIAMQAGPNGPIGSGEPVEIGLDTEMMRFNKYA